MLEAAPKLTVYFDGSCPLCSAEITHYRSRDRAEAITFTDVSCPLVVPGCDLDRQAAMARLHVRLPDGRLASGAEAFIAIWRVLPSWRWVACMATLPGMPMLLELAYRSFLPIRPVLARIAGALTRRSEGRP